MSADIPPEPPLGSVVIKYDVAWTLDGVDDSGWFAPMPGPDGHHADWVELHDGTLIFIPEGAFTPGGDA